MFSAPATWLGPGQCTHPVQAKPLTESERRAVDGLLSMWRIQQRERDRITGYQLRVFLALVALVCVLAACTCLAAICCACFTNKPQRVLHPSHGKLDETEGGEHESDDEEHHKAENNMWHRP